MPSVQSRVACLRASQAWASLVLLLCSPGGWVPTVAAGWVRERQTLDPLAQRESLGVRRHDPRLTRYQLSSERPASDPQMTYERRQLTCDWYQVVP